MACDTVAWSVPATQNWFTFTLTRGVLHLVTVRAINDAGAGPFAAEISVSSPLMPPLATRSDRVGTSLSLDVPVTDPDGSTLTFSAAALPPGLTIDTRSGRISGTPTTVGTYRPSVTVSDTLGSDTQAFTWTIAAAAPGGGGGATTPMTSVALSFTPTTPQAVGTAVALSALGQGGTGTPSYRFWVQPWGGAWQILQDWSASSTITWRPAVAGGYTLTVYGRNGTTGEGDVNASRAFEVTATGSGGGGASSPMTSVTLSYAPTTPQPVGTSVVLTARGQGGSGTPAYRFWVQPWGGAWQIIQDWSTSATVTWRPAAAGGYNLTVYGRNGTSGNGEVSTSRTFEATASGTGGGGGGGGTTSPMTSVALSFSPTTPQAVGAAVVLTARGQGGSGTPAYRFLVQPWGGAWQVVQDWSASTSVTWRPTAAGGYNLTVYGRNGSTGQGDVTDNRTFEVQARGGGGGGGASTPMNNIALSFAPTTPQPVGTSVVITARGQGGSGTPVYRFWVQPWGGAWQMVQDWSTATSVVWRPGAAGGYNLTVYGRNGTTGEGDVSDSRTFEARR